MQSKHSGEHQQRAGHEPRPGSSLRFGEYSLVASKLSPLLLVVVVVVVVPPPFVELELELEPGGPVPIGVDDLDTMV